MVLEAATCGCVIKLLAALACLEDTANVGCTHGLELINASQMVVISSDTKIIRFVIGLELFLRGETACTRS